MKSSSRPLIFLHGWGGSSSSLKKPTENLINDFLVFAPDLPGFGKTSPPDHPWKVADYANYILKFAQSKNLKKFFLVGHSFGGRIAIKIAALYPQKVEKLVLCNSSGTGRGNLLKRIIFFFLAKTGNLLFYLWPLCLGRPLAKSFLYKLAKEKDYLKTKGIMRQTFKNIIVEDQTHEIQKIKVPTLILWAQKDKQTPPRLGYEIHSLIKNSKLIIIPHATHGLPFLDPQTFARHVLAFFKKDSP